MIDIIKNRKTGLFSGVIVFILLGFSNGARSQSVTIESDIDWEYLQYVDTMNLSEFRYFINAEYSDAFEPQYVTVMGFVSEPIETHEFDKFKPFLPDTLVLVTAKKRITQKKNAIELAVLPLRWNKQTNKIERITHIKALVDGLLMEKQVKTKAKLLSNSVLANGNWYKLKISQSGVYRLTFEQLTTIGLSDPSTVRVYNRGGKQLLHTNPAELESGLVETPILMEKGSDGIFNEGDYILFYAQGPVTWNYNTSTRFFTHQAHGYSNAIYFFITSGEGAGLRIPTTEQPTLAADYQTSTFDSYLHYEQDVVNPIRSGSIFYDEKMKSGDSYPVGFQFNSLMPNNRVDGTAYFAIRNLSDAPACAFSISYNNTVLSSLTMSNTVGSYVYGARLSSNFNLTPEGNAIALTVGFGGGNTTSEAYLDYVELNARENLIMPATGQLEFRDKNALGYSVSEFTLKGTNVTVWDVTNPVSPAKVSTTQSGENAIFKANTTALKEFIAFDGSHYLTPEWQGEGLGLIANQNLTSVQNIEMVIVSHPNFLAQANELADFHRVQDTLNVLVVTPTEIYNEFSGGTPDIGAIRNFMRYLYDMEGDSVKALKYLLLYGDGSYDNKDIANSHSNFIFTYQNAESMAETVSYVTDDFYGILDAGENVASGTLDIGVGRLPVKSLDESQLMVDKVKQYYTTASLGPWRSQICLIGDNGDGELHMEQANEVSEKVLSEHPAYNVNKILFEAFPKISTPAGDRFPQVTAAINDQMQQGALIVDYVGHGNPRILAHEEVIHVEDVLSWTNYDKLSVFVTASCEVGRFDDYSRTSLGEYMLLSEKGAGIAAFTTTRVVYANANHALNTNFFNHVLNPENRLGDVIRLAKNQTGGTNMRNFSLLGDPAIKLMVPQNGVVVSSIEKQTDAPQKTDRNYDENADLYQLSQYDTLNALSVAQVSGYIVDHKGDVIFKNGTVYPTVYDKSTPLIVLNQTSQTPDTVTIQNNVLFRGQASITDGFFSFSFMVPKDINYTMGMGKLSLYAVLDDNQALGYTADFYIGGSSMSAEPDWNGPEIQLFMNDTLFVNGGTTNDSPVLLALLTDESGINTTGNGIGHNITAVLDNKTAEPILLNGYYQSNLNLYNKGSIAYPMRGLSEGPHTITLKVWDVYNNSSEQPLEFVVFNGNSLAINHLFNYPNPMSGETNFSFEHNHNGKNAKVIIRIYDISGANVAAFTKYFDFTGFKIPDITWDGTSNNGAPLSNGLYIYQVELQTSDGLKTTASSKLMIFR